MEISTTKETTEELLFEWGQWARENPGVSLSYPSETSFAKEMARRRIMPPSSISHKDALDVDSAVSAIKNSDALLNEILVNYFLIRMDIRSIAKQLGRGKTTTKNIKDQAVCKIDGILLGKKLCTDKNP
mgnify:CR=1 FL=1